MKRCLTSLIIRECTSKCTSPHTRRNGHHQKDHKQHVLVRMWRKLTLVHCWWGSKWVYPLWRSTDGPKKTWKQNYHMIQQSQSWVYTGENERTNLKRYMRPVFRVALFTIAKTEATSVSTNRWTDKEDVVYIYHGILLSHKNEWNVAICSNSEGILLSEISQTEKDKYYTSLICGI